jgi:hypothetical protein
VRPPEATRSSRIERSVKLLLELLKNILTGAIFGVVCAAVVFALSALFGNFGGVAGARSLSPVLAPHIFAMSIAAARAGAINYTLARYLLLPRSPLWGVLPNLAVATVVGALLGLYVAVSNRWGYPPIIIAEVVAISFFWLAGLAMSASDARRGKDPFNPIWRLRRF